MLRSLHLCGKLLFRFRVFEGGENMHFPFGVILTGIAVYIAYRIGKSAGKEEIKEKKVAEKK